MVGFLDVLERTGFLKQAPDAASAETVVEPATPTAPPVPVEESSGMTISQVYEAAGVPAAVYPAERLLRLLAGLKEMDPATRLTAIKAMDAADDSWSIDDPMRDAGLKAAALEAHANTIRAGIAQAEQETQAGLATSKERHEAAQANIRRQLDELNGLLAREIARGTQDGVALEAALQGKKEHATRELARLANAAGELRGLMAQFNVKTTE